MSTSQPPVTDQEWAQALANYGRDRTLTEMDMASRILDKPRSHSPIASPDPLVRPPLTKDHDSCGSLNSIPEAGQPGPSCRRYSAVTPSRQGSHNTAYSETFLSPSASRTDLVDHPACRSYGSRASFGSEYSDYVPGRNVFAGAGWDIKGPPGHSSSPLECSIEDRKSADAVRSRLRTHYEKEGWLPAPEPSRTTRMRRRRAIRRLGLFHCQDENQERQHVIQKHAALAKDIFQTTHAAVYILHEGEGVVWDSTLHLPPSKTISAEAASSHFLTGLDDRACTVIPDMLEDWRFKANPSILAHGMRFYASTPLRYTHKGSSVDIGTLCVWEEKPRHDFGPREEGILQSLAEMLVFQLSTLQSQIMAQQSSRMYEQSITFLRRSVMPDTLATNAKAEKEQKEADKTQRRKRRQHKAATANASSIDEHVQHTYPSRLVPSHLDAIPEPSLAVKRGPRDSKIAERSADLSNKELFTDAANTLRSILRADAVAIVNIEEYQLFIRRDRYGDGRSKITSATKEAILRSFMQGKAWSAGVEPVIHHAPRGNSTGVQVLGVSSDKPCSYHFDNPGAEHTITEFLTTWLKTRHFWWDREDAKDDLSQRVIGLMPDEAQTSLAMGFLTHDGQMRFAMFASWNKSPAEFGDCSISTLPFAWILGGCTMAALAVRKVRQLEQSQISYSNLQAHELRTPLHQILGITQLLRSSIKEMADKPQGETTSLNTTQQSRDLLPLLDAIDTSGRTLNGIVDNILSFLDLRSKDNLITPQSPTVLPSTTATSQSLETMFEELIHEASEEDARYRKANFLPPSSIETVFEIIPPLLGEQVTEDAGGSLRKALGKILANAYKFIEDEGCVGISVDDVEEMLPPADCEDLCSTKRIRIRIEDNGKGMDAAFVRDKLGEPWAKEDPYATGSGLSVHLAYRIIDLMGGRMEVRSGKGQGCCVDIEVAVPRRPVITPTPELINSPSLPATDPTQMLQKPEDTELGRKVALAGFDLPGPGLPGRRRLHEALERQYVKLGCYIVPAKNAELIIADGGLEETIEGVEFMNNTPATNIVFLVGPEHHAHSDVLLREHQRQKNVRRFQKPITPSILRESLFPGQSKALLAEVQTENGVKQENVNAPEAVDPNGRPLDSPSFLESLHTASDRLRAHFSDSIMQPKSGSELTKDIEADIKTNVFSSDIVSRLAHLWKPRNVDMEEAVACLSLGDYFSSRKHGVQRTPSVGSSTGPLTPDTSSIGGDQSETTNATSVDDVSRRRSVDSEGLAEFTRVKGDPDGDVEGEEEEAEVPVDEPVKVLVVEDNMVNRKILVKILSKLPVEVVEAEDGVSAVNAFESLTAPAIVLLDINMPHMDGYQACLEMRAMEKALGRDTKSHIIAITALGSDSERHRGLVECGMDQWHIKPCSKAKIQKIVEDAREVIRRAKSGVEGGIPYGLKRKVDLVQ